MGEGSPEMLQRRRTKPKVTERSSFWQPRSDNGEICGLWKFRCSRGANWLGPVTVDEVTMIREQMSKAICLSLAERLLCKAYGNVN